MAVIDKLSINQFRNLTNQYLEPGKNINLIVANNAQGKTNFIEAIYYLGHNRSFKTKSIKELTNFDCDTFQLAAQIDSKRIKLEKSKQKTSIKINRQPVKNTSELTQVLPIQIITPDKGFIVNGTPKNKRSYLDWGVFHVEPELLLSFKNYNKALKNINSLLINRSKKELDYWFLEIATISVIINKSRIKYIEKLKQINSNRTLVNLSDLFESIELFDYHYKSGWPKEVDALDKNSVYQYLVKNKDNLCRAKYLNYGPHKASIVFSLNDRQECFLSRGEQKTLSIIFWLTQVMLLVKSNVNPVVLIDDISSELDVFKIKTILYYLNTLNIQTFITDIRHDLSVFNDQNTTVFSITNGVINKQ